MLELYIYSINWVGKLDGERIDTTLFYPEMQYLLILNKGRIEVIMIF
jgi:hypothetical protein